MREGDELRSPSRCARCASAFMPPPDTLVTCPSCGACHATDYRSILVAYPRLREIAQWTAAIVGDPTHLFLSSDGFQRTVARDPNGQSVILRQAEVHEAMGYSVLVDRSQHMLRARVAAFFPGAMPSHAWVGGHRASVYRWGLELRLEGPSMTLWASHGLGALAAAIAEAARNLGAEPIFWLAQASGADARQLLTRAPASTRDRTVRCSGCCAPISLRAVAASSRRRCPYCAHEVAVPAELAHELAQHERRVAVHDALRYLDGHQLWSRWSTADVEPRLLACVVCGAPRAHQWGALDETCQHCGATIVPSAARLAEDVAHAREAAAEKQRRAHAVARQRDVSARSSMMISFVGAAVLILGVCGFSLAFVVLEGDPAKLAMSLPMIFMGLLVAGVAIWVRRRRMRLRSRWARVWAGLAEQLAGQPLDGPGVRAWLGRRWSGTVVHGRPDKAPSAAHGGVAFTIDGMDGLVEGSLDRGIAGITGSDHPWIHVFVRVEWNQAAGVLKDSAGVRARREALRVAGFRTSLARDGLALVAVAGVIERFETCPSSAAVLAPVIYEASRIARLLRE